MIIFFIINLLNLFLLIFYFVILIQIKLIIFYISLFHIKILITQIIYHINQLNYLIHIIIYVVIHFHTILLIFQINFHIHTLYFLTLTIISNQIILCIRFLIYQIIDLNYLYTLTIFFKNLAHILILTLSIIFHTLLIFYQDPPIILSIKIYHFHIYLIPPKVFY